MRKSIFLVSAAALMAVPAMAQQVGVDVDAGAAADVGATVQTPDAADTMDAVQDTVDTATDTAAETVDQATDTAADAVDEAGRAAAGTQVEAAVAADVTAGAEVRDTDGNMVGTIESVDANGAVISTGKARVQIPVSSFAKNDEGLVIAMSKAELEAAAEAAAQPG